MRQAIRQDNLRSVRNENPSGRTGQKITRRKWRRLGKMGIARQSGQTSALSPAQLHALTGVILNEAKTPSVTVLAKAHTIA
jgi:hypothetical protein